MHLISSLLCFALGAILINSAPFDQKLKTGSQEVKDLSEISAVRQNSPILSLTTFRDVIKGHSHGFCFRRLALSLAPDTPSGFKGWIRKYHSGFLAVHQKLYHFFRCSPNQTLRKLKRAKRSPQRRPPLPRPCINDTLPNNAEDDVQERNPLCIQEEEDVEFGSTTDGSGD
ncbi:unnamed protein product [Porites evermanni]|uniref:Uncharacterized protein n=1 Tax=Porites evermanni TaxID=104178 RepID=A0ABN8RIE7_9CNID|nr:unnamed protein product [Porites evermanni]